jgi:hypothetical protein
LQNEPNFLLRFNNLVSGPLEDDKVQTIGIVFSPDPVSRLRRQPARLFKPLPIDGCYSRAIVVVAVPSLALPPTLLLP